MPRSRLLLSSLALLLACDSAGPSSQTTFDFTGQVTIDGHAPDPNTILWLAATRPEVPGYDITRLQLDSLGQFGATITPIGPTVDTLILTAVQYACSDSPTAAIRYTAFRIPAAPFRWPTLQLPSPPVPGVLVQGVTLCGALDGYPTSDDLLWVNLALDSVADSVYGRYSFRHAASIGASEGVLRGALVADTLHLLFDPTVTSECTGVTLAVPVGGAGTLGLAQLSGTLAGNCHIYSGRFRLHPLAGAIPRIDGARSSGARAD